VTDEVQSSHDVLVSSDHKVIFHLMETWKQIKEHWRSGGTSDNRDSPGRSS
jgi:hypothetical protein